MTLHTSLNAWAEVVCSVLASLLIVSMQRICISEQTFGFHAYLNGDNQRGKAIKTTYPTIYQQVFNAEPELTPNDF